MIGEYLKPLNRLKDEDETLYTGYIKKYKDHPKRIKLLKRTIPKLDCLWNDVVHFLPLHPHHVYSALNNLGVNVRKDLLFYKIPVENLSVNSNVLYKYGKHDYQGPESAINEQNIIMINVEDYEAPTALPKDTHAYYKEEHAKGNTFGMFQFIPHVLSYGEVNITNADVLNWSDPI